MTGFTPRWAAAGIMALGFVLSGGMAASASAVPQAAQPRTAVTRIAAPYVSHVPRLGGPVRVRTTPDIQEASCTSSRKNWVHIDSSEGNLCFGSTGTADFYPYPQVAQFCAGNNHGNYEFYNANNGGYYINYYSAGYIVDYAPGIYIISVTINGWSGSDFC